MSKISKFFGKLFNDTGSSKAEYCGKNKQNAEACLLRIQEKFPEVIVCKPLGHGAGVASSISHFPSVEHLMPDVAGLIFNSAHDSIIGVQRPDGTVAKIQPAIEAWTAKLPSHVANVPVVRAIDKASEKSMQSEVKESDEVASNAERKDIVKAVEISSEVPEAPPLAPPMSPAQKKQEIPMAPPMHMTRIGDDTVVIMNNPTVPKKAELLRENGNDALLKAIQNGFKLKKVKVAEKAEIKQDENPFVAALAKRRLAIAGQKGPTTKAPRSVKKGNAETWDT